MPNADIRDYNIRYVGHPKYNSKRVIEDRTIEFVVQKLENLLFTNKGDDLSDPEFGANIEYYLWSTKVPVEKIKKEIENQINKYISELNIMGYSLNLELYKGTIRDILYININIKDTIVNFVIK